MNPELKEKLNKLKNKVGLTGGTASGKSTVSKVLASQGFTVLDFDVIAREVRAEPAIQQELKSKFHTVNPKEIRENIFSNKENKLWLENFLAERILDKAIGLTEQATDSGKKPVIWDSALIIEFDLQSVMDLTVIVCSEQASRLARLTERDKISQELALKMINNQTTDAEKIEKVKNFPHVIIHNNQSIFELTRETEKLGTKLRGIYGT